MRKVQNAIVPSWQTARSIKPVVGDSEDLFFLYCSCLLLTVPVSVHYLLSFLIQRHIDFFSGFPAVLLLARFTIVSTCPSSQIWPFPRHHGLPTEGDGFTRPKNGDSCKSAREGNLQLASCELMKFMEDGAIISIGRQSLISGRNPVVAWQLPLQELPRCTRRNANRRKELSASGWIGSNF
jgi:hypothetical protein